MSNFVVLISGMGSNLQAICESELTDNITVVISNNPHALGLGVAKQYHIPTVIVNHKDYKNRNEFEDKLLNVINQHNPDYIVLAGFMRILSARFVNQYPNRIVNIHPSLLPSFTGGSAQKQTYDARVKISGLTIHFVTPSLDSGPIIAQGVVPVLLNDTYEVLKARILELEHVMYPFIIKKLINNKISIMPDGFVVVEHEASDNLFLKGNITNVYF